ncbi:HPr family phosphocarrier protein [Metabacillus rhizolycopersici]|uniref:HPr family phosphocarrier protein n=1 Tax=Metabacillus rhizolycopersici TaxID=2875709 RepID=UPI0021E10BFE|nr:HPr family phosphocarrier protein [Metabacillus rhizolycopersici]
MIAKQYKVTMSSGFARPATLLVRVACIFTSKIYLEYKGKSVDLKNSPESIMDVMSLGIENGSEFSLTAEGVDQLQALETIENCLVKKKIIK